MSKSARFIKNLLAVCYAIAVLIVGGVVLFSFSSLLQGIVEHFNPSPPDVIDFMMGDWQ